MWSCRHKEIWADHSINPETESSQATGKSSKFSFLETVRSEGIFKLYSHTETCAASNPKTRVSKQATHEPSVRDEGLPFPTKEFGNYSRALDILNGSIRDKCVFIWRMFMSSSMKAAMHIWPNYLANLEFYKNTNFEECQSLFNITQKLMLGRDWECISFMDEISIVPRSSDPVDKSKSTWLLRFWSMLGKDDWQQRCNDNLGRSSGRIQCVLLVTKNCWESMEKQFHSSGTFFSKDFRHCRFFKGARMICDARNCIREEFQNKVWLYSAISRIYKATKIAMQAKVSFRWSMTIWFTNWFLCIKQRRLRMQKLQWTRNGKSSRQFHHVNWKKSWARRRLFSKHKETKESPRCCTDGPIYVAPRMRSYDPNYKNTKAESCSVVTL